MSFSPSKTFPMYQFVVMEFTYNKLTKKETKKLFVAKVTEKIVNRSKVSCLICCGMTGSTVVFPNVEDISLVDTCQIKCALIDPVEIRGRFTFKDDFFLIRFRYRYRFNIFSTFI